MYETVENRVKVKVQKVDGCGNPVKPPTAGAIRRALEPLADSVVLNEIMGGEK